MWNDEALNFVICSMNANIHVVVHKDLHEINLLNVESKFCSLWDGNHSVRSRQYSLIVVGIVSPVKEK
jgi:hypothetical protein